MEEVERREINGKHCRNRRMDLGVSRVLLALKLG